MRRLVKPVALCAMAFAAGTVSGAAGPVDRVDRLLAKYVTQDGVRYDAWRENAADASELAAIVAELSATDPGELSDAERYALYINLYNAKVIELVLQHAPPNSIRNITKARFGYGVFFKKYLSFDGEAYSLNKLEKRLRQESGDPRVHVAVNCASRSCPPLLPRAYRAEDLDSTLDERAREFLASPRNLSLEETGSGKPVYRLHLSKIFDWFEDDFKTTGGVVEFVKRYGPDEIAARLNGNESGIKLSYIEYDWSLNRADGDRTERSDRSAGSSKK